MINIYKKVNAAAYLIEYFATHEYEYKSENIQRLIKTMSPKDRTLFFCDLNEINWMEYFSSFIMGIRLYLTEDPLESMEHARRRFKM